MKSRETLIRLRRFEVDERRQRLADIESMINEFRQMAADLDRQIAAEQERAGVSDVNHFAYPTFAKAAIGRRENLLASAQDLETKLEKAREDLAVAFEELKKVELIEERDADRSRLAMQRSEQAELDHIAAHPHRA
jgi:flagellar export protein FliJ